MKHEANTTPATPNAKNVSFSHMIDMAILEHAMCSEFAGVASFLLGSAKELSYLEAATISASIVAIAMSAEDIDPTMPLDGICADMAEEPLSSYDIGELATLAA